MVGGSVNNLSTKSDHAQPDVLENAGAEASDPVDAIMSKELSPKMVIAPFSEIGIRRYEAHNAST